MAEVFCPWEEDEEDLHSPTDVSEDSVDVKVKPVAGSKRKCTEPRKCGEVKRRVISVKRETETEQSPFRPWSQPPTYAPLNLSPSDLQDEPLSLVLPDKVSSSSSSSYSPHAKSRPRPPLPHAKSRPRPQDVVRLRHPPDNTVTVSLKPEYSSVGRVQETDASGKTRIFSVESLISGRPEAPSSTPSTSFSDERVAQSRTESQLLPQQRNYKNMTRERRVEANARERTRVHTISAAFDTLRRAVPAYSHNQKLSKLSVLRIACAYILTLSRVAGDDYSADNSEPPLGDCVDHVTRTIQLEGKLRKKKDD